MYYGYNFYFKDDSDVLTFPITPNELTIEVGSNNKVVTLISEGEVNILKSPSLTTVKFDARFPMRQYPYAREFANFESYWNKFQELKEKKKHFRFIVARTTPGGVRTWDTNLLVALENVSIKERVEDGDDVIVSFSLKQYKEYGVKTIKLPAKSENDATSSPPTPPASTSTSTSEKPRSSDKDETESKPYVVNKGDCLWKIAKKHYGDGSKYKEVYFANETVIENAAKKNGRQSSSNGNWIYPSTPLVMPSMAAIKSKNSKQSLESRG